MVREQILTLQEISWFWFVATLSCFNLWGGPVSGPWTWPLWLSVSSFVIMIALKKIWRTQIKERTLIHSWSLDQLMYWWLLYNFVIYPACPHRHGWSQTDPENPIWISLSLSLSCCGCDLWVNVLCLLSRSVIFPVHIYMYDKVVQFLFIFGFDHGCL